MSNIAAFFDIDGTIHRSSLLIEHLKKMIKYEIMPKDIFSEIEPSYIDWDKRQGDYEKYLDTTCKLYQNSIAGLSVRDIEFTVNQVMKLTSDKLYTYTRDQITWHLSQGHKVIFLSGSPSFLVSKMAEKFNITDYRGSEYLTENNIFTGDIIPMWDSISKSKAIDELINKYDIDLEKSYAYGDTNGDYIMLNRVGNPVAVNPSKELFNRILNESDTDKFLVCVERKDNIYCFKPTNVTIK